MKKEIDVFDYAGYILKNIKKVYYLQLSQKIKSIL